MGKRWARPWVIIGGFGSKFSLVHCRGPYMEVDLDGMRPANRVLDAIGCDGELRLHFKSAKFTIHYLADPRAQFFQK